MRTPLAVGYIYLLDLWLIFADYLTRKASGGVISDVIELRGWLGKGALLAAVSFAAYPIGALNIISPTILLKQILTLRLRVSDRFGPFAEPLPRSFSAALWDLARRQGFGGKFISTSKIQSVAGEAVAQRYDLRTKLLIADKEVYGEYDRLESEAEFRLNVSIPLAVLFGL